MYFDKIHYLGIHLTDFPWSNILKFVLNETIFYVKWVLKGFVAQ